MRVRFLKNYTTDCRLEDRQSFQAGQVYDLPEPSAYYFMGRGLAEAAKPETAEPASEPEEEEPSPEPTAEGTKAASEPAQKPTKKR